jgi:hypothetical protein
MEFQRTGFKIKRNHSNALPRYILSISVEYETDETKSTSKSLAHKFRSVSVVSGRFVRSGIVGTQSNSFSDVASFWRFVYGFTKPNYTTWIIGDNVLTQLIVCGLPGRFARGEISIDRPRSKRKREDNDEENVFAVGLAVLESPPTIVGCRVGSTQGRIVIVDSRNWFPDGISTGTPAAQQRTARQNAVVDSDNSRLTRNESQATGILGTFETLILWVKDNDMGLFRYTAGSQAMGAFRHRFMSHNIYVHDNTEIQKLERRCYYGGRSEVFKLGTIDGTVRQLDVSSLFPSCMRSGSYPCMLRRSEQREELIELLPSIDWSAACADVEIQTDKPLYPLRTDTNVIFPIGRFTTSLAGSDLYRAYRAGCIRRVGSWAEYKLAPLFTLWVDTLWHMRQEYRRTGNVLYEKFTKQIMNSLYGKFAQLTPAWVNIPGDHSMLPWTNEARRDKASGDWIKYRSIGWEVQRQDKRVERPASFYAISAFVTAEARARMDWLRRVAGKPHVYYQGVDSLIVNKRGYENLVLSDEVAENALGKLRLQYESDYCVIRGVSDYEIGSRVVLSSKSANSEISDDGQCLQHKYYVMNNLFKNGPINTIEEKLEPWVRQSKYNKGIVAQDGWVEPFELGAMPISSGVGVGSPAAAAAASPSNSGL